MFSEIGNLLLLLSLLLSIINLILLLRRKDKFLVDLIFIFLTLSIFCLLYSFIINDFSIAVVFSNSHISLPIFYKIPALWSSHEGSILFWSWILSLYNLLLQLVYPNYNIIQSEFKIWKIKLYYYDIIKLIQSIFLIFFLSFTWFTSNPFLQSSLLILNGSELNPLLQDPILAIHPPILYLGYIGLSLPFSFAIALLLTQDIKEIKNFNLFTIIPWGFLTLGITLGSWWAYYELGWGGFWFWDPVENIALLPWIVTIGLLHSLLIQRQRKKLILMGWIINLAALAFFLSLIGTFFVRAGLLSSVHSFVSDRTRGNYLIWFILIIGVIYISLIFLNRKHIFNKKPEDISKETLIYLLNWLSLLITLIIILGTFAPNFYQYFCNRQISIGPDFYNKHLVPFILLIIILMIITPYLKWKTDKIKIENYFFTIGFIIIITLYLINKEYKIVTILLVSLSSGLIISNINLVYISSFKLNKNMILGHMGFGLIMLAIALTNELELVKLEILNIGDKIRIMDYIITMKDINEIEGSNFSSQYGEYIVVNKDTKELLGILKPDNRFYYNQGILTNKSVIHSNYLGDLYMILGEGNFKEGYRIIINYKPYMIEI